MWNSSHLLFSSLHCYFSCFFLFIPDCFKQVFIPILAFREESFIFDSSLIEFGTDSPDGFISCLILIYTQIYLADISVVVEYISQSICSHSAKTYIVCSFHPSLFMVIYESISIGASNTYTSLSMPSCLK